MFRLQAPFGSTAHPSGYSGKAARASVTVSGLLVIASGASAKAYGHSANIFGSFATSSGYYANATGYSAKAFGHSAKAFSGYAVCSGTLAASFYPISLLSGANAYTFLTTTFPSFSALSSANSPFQDPATHYLNQHLIAAFYFLSFFNFRFKKQPFCHLSLKKH